MKKYLILIFSILSLFSCQKQTNTQFPKSMDNIVVPSDFNWESTKEINLKIHSQNSQIISISSSENYNTYSKYYFNGNDSIYSTTINIPSNEKDIYINSHKIDLTSYSETIELDIDTLFANKVLKKTLDLYIPISIWHLDEGIGNNIEDSEGRNNGIMSGASWVNGISNSALAFNGENSNINIPNSDNLNLSTELTIMAWVRIYEHKESKIVQNGDKYGIGIEERNGFKGYIHLSSGESAFIKWINGRPILNEWYHVAITYNGQELKIYINGQVNNSKTVTGLIVFNNNPFSIGSDNADQNFFNGVIDEVVVYANALNAEEILNYYNGETNTDTDGDGIPDEEDDYPEDISRSFNNFWPNENNGTIMFEDLWPVKGDCDFNDMVLDFRINKITNSKNKLVEIKINFLLKAIGTGISNGFGFQLNNEISKEDIVVEGYQLVSNYITLDNNGLESNQDKAVIIVFDDANQQMPSHTGFGVNVETGKPYVEPVEFEITISLTENKYSISDFNSEDFNPFIIINKERGKEVHLSNFPPTLLADKALFGTSDDNSNEGQRVYYKSTDNLPWAILVPSVIKQPLEEVQISSAYLNFYEWASSGGEYFTDWFRNSPTNVEETKVYNPPCE